MDNKDTELILITNCFPINKGETFLAVEYPYLKACFDKIHLVVRAKNMPEFTVDKSEYNISILPAKSSTLKSLLNLLFFILNFRKNWRILKIEIAFLKSKGLYNKVRLKTALHDLIKAFEIKRFIKKNLISNDKKYVIYSYWQNNAALAATMIGKENNNCKSICRAHGGDLYAYRNSDNYLSYRTYISKYIDRLYFISQDGYNYQSNLLNNKYESFEIAKLGTEKYFNNIKNNLHSNAYIIVSCSNIIPLKRLNLIIEALSLCESKINWIHFGDGSSADFIKTLAKEKLDKKENIVYKFMGYTPNEDIHRYYAENKVDLFINVSESEGVPVSIMEAMSYDIPVIATNVGGTAELVNNSCGCLLNKDCTPKQISDAIENELKNNKLDAAYTKWNNEYNAAVNFTEFVNNL